MASIFKLPTYLKMYRKRSGLTQAEVAFLLGCTHGSKVSRHERGAREPTLRVLLEYEMIFRVPMRKLFAGRCADITKELKGRVQKLLRRLDSLSDTPLRKHKFNWLVGIEYPPLGNNINNEEDLSESTLPKSSGHRSDH